MNITHHHGKLKSPRRPCFLNKKYQVHKTTIPFARYMWTPYCETSLELLDKLDKNIVICRVHQLFSSLAFGLGTRTRLSKMSSFGGCERIIVLIFSL